MNLLNKLTDKEIILLKNVGINPEDKDYTNEELRMCESKITDYIVNHSSKNGDINKLQEQYNNVFKIINAE